MDERMKTTARVVAQILATNVAAPRDACSLGLGIAAGAAKDAGMSEAEFVAAARLIFNGGRS
jgi:hypothetical protein